MNFDCKSIDVVHPCPPTVLILLPESCYVVARDNPALASFLLRRLRPTFRRAALWARMYAWFVYYERIRAERCMDPIIIRHPDSGVA